MYYISIIIAAYMLWYMLAYKIYTIIYYMLVNILYASQHYILANIPNTGALSYSCMRPSATSVRGLKLLVYEALCY